MSLDSRFPNLYRVKDAPNLSADLRGRCADFVDAVFKRVPGVKGVYNAVRQELFFYFIDPSAGPVSIPVIGEDAWALDQRDIDDTVSVLNLALSPLAERERRREQKEKQEAAQRAQDLGKSLEDNRKKLWGLAEVRRRQKRGLSSLTVDMSPTARYAAKPSGLLVPRDTGV